MPIKWATDANIMMKKQVVALTGVQGSGKSSICRALLEKRPDIVYVSASAERKKIHRKIGGANHNSQLGPEETKKVSRLFIKKFYDEHEHKKETVLLDMRTVFLINSKKTNKGRIVSAYDLEDLMGIDKIVYLKIKPHIAKERREKRGENDPKRQSVIKKEIGAEQKKTIEIATQNRIPLLILEITKDAIENLADRVERIEKFIFG